MADAARARKLSKRIATIVASAIEFEIKDPPLAFVTVTDTKVTGDLHDATVFYTVSWRDPAGRARLRGRRGGSGAGQGHAASKVGAGTGVRFTPTLTFVLDTVPDSAREWRICWPARGRPTPIWREFARVPDRRVTPTRTA